MYDTNLIFESQQVYIWDSQVFYFLGFYNNKEILGFNTTKYKPKKPYI